MSDNHENSRLPQRPGKGKPMTMRERYYSLSPAERKAQRDLFSDPYMEVRIERLRQQYRTVAVEDPAKAEGAAEMLKLLDELESVNKEMRQYFYNSIPEARPKPRGS